MATNKTPESFEQNRARAHCAYMRKRNEVATAIAADDELDIVVWISEECKELSKVAEAMKITSVLSNRQTRNCYKHRKHDLFKFSRTSWNSKG